MITKRTEHSEQTMQLDPLTPKSFSFICRTCLVFNDIIFNINEVRWEDVGLPSILENWISLSQSKEDQMPPNMCKPCIKLAYYFYEFVLKCRKSEKILKQVLNLEASSKFGDKDKDIESDFAYSPKEDVKDEVTNKMLVCDDEDSFMNSIDNNHFDEIDCAIPNDSRASFEDNGVVGAEVGIIQSLKKEIKDIRVQNNIKLRKLQKARLILSVNSTKLRRHYKKIKGPPYTCITCQSTYRSYEALKKHKIETKHRKSLRYTCQHCNKKYDAHTKYVEHCRTHTGEKPNICETCGKAFNFKTDLKRHMILHGDTKPYTCRLCDKGFTRKQYLKDHERKHTGERLICSFCGRGFHSYSTLTYHEKTHKGPPGVIRDPLTIDRLFQCDLCKKVLLTEQTLKSHILLHGPKNFSCEKCGKTYVSKQRLHDHIRFAHQDQTFDCKICKKTYKHKNGLEIHLKSHYGENVYPCETCGKKFACKGSLYQHRRIHNGDTTYQCQTCLHICINKRHLENHVRTHTGEKPFACMFCGKAFAQKANMVAHSRMHTDEKNHWCKECGKGFYDRRGLKKHMVVHDKPELDPDISLRQNFVPKELLTSV